jgi:hypothetical protein
MKKILFFLLITLSFSGCFKSSPDPYYSTGYHPIYLSRTEMEKVFVTTPQSLKVPGKIYIKDGFLFVNEVNKGVHIFNNKDPKSPQKIAFIQIPGNIDIAIRGAILYADNGRDLLSFDVTTPTEARLLNRMKDIFPNQEFPPYTGTSFECVDNAKGTVVGWEKIDYNHPDYKSVQSFKCFR